jgi:hypothetical protein
MSLLALIQKQKKKTFTLSLHLDSCRLIIAQDTDCVFVLKQGKHYQSHYFNMRTRRIPVHGSSKASFVPIEHQFTRQLQIAYNEENQTIKYENCTVKLKVLVLADA